MGPGFKSVMETSFLCIYYCYVSISLQNVYTNFLIEKREGERKKFLLCGEDGAGCRPGAGSRGTFTVLEPESILAHPFWKIL